MTLLYFFLPFLASFHPHFRANWYEVPRTQHLFVSFSVRICTNRYETVCTFDFSNSCIMGANPL